MAMNENSSEENLDALFEGVPSRTTEPAKPALAKPAPAPALAKPAPSAMATTSSKKKKTDLDLDIDSLLDDFGEGVVDEDEQKEVLNKMAGEIDLASLFG